MDGLINSLVSSEEGFATAASEVCVQLGAHLYGTAHCFAFIFGGVEEKKKKRKKKKKTLGGERAHERRV